MRAFIRFNQGVMRSPLPVRLWLMLLVAANLGAPLFFLDHLEAQVVLACFMASVALMTILTGLTGFTRLLSVGHIFWIPMLFWLWNRSDQIPAQDAFGIWIRVLLAANLVSLLLDTVEVIRYIRGEREETVKSLPAQ